MARARLNAEPDPAVRPVTARSFFSPALPRAASPLGSHPAASAASAASTFQERCLRFVGTVYAGRSSVVVSRRRLDRANPRTYLSAPGVVYFAAYAASTAAFVRSVVRVIAFTRSSRPAA